MPPREYIVSEGEDASAVAARFGFGDTRKIWALAENASLRARRPDGILLFPGDVVFVPELEAKYVTAKEKAENRFKVTIPRITIRLRIRTPSGEARAGVEFKIRDGRTVVAEGATGDDGVIEVELPARVHELRLTTADGIDERLRVGGLNPMRDVPDGGVSGVAQRIRALGYLPRSGALPGRDTLDMAIRAFRRDEGLPSPEDAVIDDALVNRLRERYGQ